MLLAACGGLGACARFLLDGVINARRAGLWPWGTVLINMSGSFLLGLLTGLVTSHLLSAPWQLIIGTGFLGGYTTFSTASFETVKLLRDGKPLASALYALGTLGGSVLASLLGLLVATLF